MADRRVRIYHGAEPEASSIIGFSASATDAVDNPSFGQFLEQRGYTWSDTADIPAESVSWRHVEVRPPLTLEHTMELGILCVGGELNDKRVEPIIDGGHNYVLVYDNRSETVNRPYDGGQLIAQG